MPEKPTSQEASQNNLLLMRLLTKKIKHFPGSARFTNTGNHTQLQSFLGWAQAPMQAGQAARHGGDALVAAQWGDLGKTLSSAAKTSGSSCLLHFSLQSSAASWLLVTALQSRTRHSHPSPCSLFLPSKLLLPNLVCFSRQQPSRQQTVVPQSYTNEIPPKV